MQNSIMSSESTADNMQASCPDQQILQPLSEEAEADVHMPSSPPTAEEIEPEESRVERSEMRLPTRKRSHDQIRLSAVERPTMTTNGTVPAEMQGPPQRLHAAQALRPVSAADSLPKASMGPPPTPGTTDPIADEDDALSSNESDLGEPDEPIEDFDWMHLEQRFHDKVKELNDNERAILAEFNNLCSVNESYHPKGV